jgi:hypothetical protein
VPLIQGGRGSRPVRRWDSWYDPQLVIQEGENILTALDTWGIGELRKHQLVWSGWGPARQFSMKPDPIPGTDWCVRDIRGIDPIKLRMFFLSLLWRAAATDLPEFSEVSVPPTDLERLRLMLLANDPNPLSFYPARLLQLSTVGETQNLTPILRDMPIQNFDGTPDRSVPIFRFYFDGLVASIHRHASDDGYTTSLGALVVGHSDRLLVGTLPYETSFQQVNLMKIKAEATDLWPHVMAKLIR